MGLAGLTAFRRARTTVNPLRPEKASALVSSGIFRYTRNPMYLALAMALLAWGLLLGHPWRPRPGGLRRVDEPLPDRTEERALAALFGDDFERYRREVRRWL